MDNFNYAVVFVDDYPFILQMLSFQLNKIIEPKTTLLECYSDPTTVLANLNELLDNQIEILIIVVDYQMPKLNGAQLIRSFKNKYPHIKCLMLSWRANDLIVQELTEEKHLEQFISKPWDEEKLYQVVRPILESVA